MKMLSKIVLSTMLVCTTITSIMGCSKDKVESGNKEGIDVTEVTGHVVYASPDLQLETTEKLMDEFMKIYPNVTVEVVPIVGDLQEYLTSQAAVGELPDIFEPQGGLTYFLEQGWMAPLDEFVKNDPEFKYALQEQVDDLRINGRLYGIPSKLAVSGVIVNMDLLNELNLEVPDYDWTIDEFLDHAKKATTTKYTGIDEVSSSSFYREYSGVFGSSITECGYDPETGKFQLTNGEMQRAINFYDEILAVPGLCATSLINFDIRGKQEDDYQKKFGKGNYGFDVGKILFKLAGSWELDWKVPNFNYDYYPLPHDKSTDYKQVIHVDPLFMTTGVKEENKQAAFEVLKFATYGRDGNLARFKLREEMEKPAPFIAIPASNHPDVAEKFLESDTPDGVKYMYENLDKSYRCEIYKVTPGMWEAMSEIILPQFERIKNGEVDYASIAAETEKKANENLEEARKPFDEVMEKNMKDYDKRNNKK